MSAGWASFLLALLVLVLTWITGWQQIWLALKNILRDNPRRSRENFRIVLCWLKGDPKGIHAETAVESAFRDIGGVELVRSARIVAASGAKDDWQPAMQQKTNKVLENWDADLAIVGLVKEKQSLCLWFVPRFGKGTLDRGDKPYKLKDMTLDKDFHANLSTTIAVAALAEMALLTDTKERGQVLQEGLRNATKKLSNLLEGSATANSPHHAVLQATLGNALLVLGERESGTKHLEEAETAYRAALEVQTREDTPYDWARTQNNLGNALSALGERESGTKHLEEAETAYRAALEVRTQDDAPYDWATTQNNLGNALLALGRRKNDKELLKQAVAAYRAALEVRTQDDAPYAWARTQNNLGNALLALGERESETKRLEEAMVAYRAALEVQTRDDAPNDWARTQTNLDKALLALSERRNDEGLL